MNKALNGYNKIFDFVAKNRLREGDVDPRKLHAHIVAVLSTGVLMWAYAFLAYFTISSPFPGIVGFSCAIVHLLSPLLFLFTSNVFLVSFVMLMSGMIHQGTFAFYTGGFESFILIWLGILPMLGGIISGRKGAITWGVITLLWTGTYLIMHLSGFHFPDLITTTGCLIAQMLIVFGWIFLSVSMILVYQIMNENKEALLSEQSKKIEDLFRVLFHDLAGPVSRIAIGLNVAKKDADQENRDYGIEIAYKATNSVLEITQNVRKMYAVSKGKVVNDLSFYSLNEAIDYVRNLYSGELEKKQISLIYDHRKFYGLSFFVEPISFKNQVLGNILSNAIKFSATNSKIIIRAYPFDQSFHVLEITDQGIGMSDSLLNSLFDVQKKTSRPGTSGEIGTGFGMHILKSFVEMYRGKIEVESSEEISKSGTKIKIYLKAKWDQEENLA